MSESLNDTSPNTTPPSRLELLLEEHPHVSVTRDKSGHLQVLDRTPGTLYDRVHDLTASIETSGETRSVSSISVRSYLEATDGSWTSHTPYSRLRLLPNGSHMRVEVESITSGSDILETVALAKTGVAIFKAFQDAPDGTNTHGRIHDYTPHLGAMAPEVIAFMKQDALF